MEPESLLPYVQEPATGSYLQPDASTPYLPHPISLNPFHQRLGLPSGAFASGFLTINRVRHRSGRLLELFFGNIHSKLKECLRKGGQHL